MKKISHFVLKLLSNVKTKLIEVRFARFFSGGFTAMAVMNPPEKKLDKRTSVQSGIFYVSRNEITRSIVHVQCTSWPDRCAPKNVRYTKFRYFEKAR